MPTIVGVPVPRSLIFAERIFKGPSIARRAWPICCRSSELAMSYASWRCCIGADKHGVELLSVVEGLHVDAEGVKKS